MATATTGNTLEADSVPLLSDEVKAVRAKVIGYLMTPAPAGQGLLSIEQVMRHLKKNLEHACSEIYYIYKLSPAAVSVDFVYVCSMETECVKIGGTSHNCYILNRAKTYFLQESDDKRIVINGMRYVDLYDQAHRRTPDIGPRSPEYAKFYEEKQKQLNGARKAVQNIVDEFISTTDLEIADDSAMVGCLLIDVWRAVTANKRLRQRDIVRLISGVLRGAGYYNDMDFGSLERLIRKWCAKADYGRDDTADGHIDAPTSS